MLITSCFFVFAIIVNNVNDKVNNFVNKNPGLTKNPGLKHFESSDWPHSFTNSIFT